MPPLATLGWDAARDAEFEPFRARKLAPGRVSLEHNHVYRVLTEEGEVLAEAAGRIKHRATGRKELPAVGDWVAVRPAPPGHRSTVVAMLDRRTAFSRKAAGRETDEQVIAANADAVLLVFGLDKPVNARAIERYLAVARRSGARPLVVLNKRDVCERLEEALAQAAAVAGGAAVHAVSAKDESGTRALEAYLEPGKTIALLGPSGAGKSSIVNCLVGGERLPTGEVRAWDRRGRHTSVHRELVLRAAGGLIIDTPGMRELQLWDGGEDLGDVFAEIVRLAGECRFRDCRHDTEPGCAVKAAVTEGRIDPERYDSYLKLRQEQADLEKRRDERALRERKRQGRVQQRALRSMSKSRGRP
jgi:ribosome biogenesis GTPase